MKQKCQVTKSIVLYGRSYLFGTKWSFEDSGLIVRLFRNEQIWNDISVETFNNHFAKLG